MPRNMKIYYFQPKSMQIYTNEGGAIKYGSGYNASEWQSDILKGIGGTSGYTQIGGGFKWIGYTN